MVDYASYFEYGPPITQNGALEMVVKDLDCACFDCKQNTGLTAKYKTHFDTPRSQQMDIWEDEQYMLCPPRILGYILVDKQWTQLQVNLVQKIARDDPEDAWNSRLQLADDHKTKDLLFDLVRSHISSAPGQARDLTDVNLKVDDIIPGKGKGLVILLYGMPLEFLSYLHHLVSY